MTSRESSRSPGASYPGFGRNSLSTSYGALCKRPRTRPTPASLEIGARWLLSRRCRSRSRPWFRRPRCGGPAVGGGRCRRWSAFARVEAGLQDLGGRRAHSSRSELPPPPPSMGLPGRTSPRPGAAAHDAGNARARSSSTTRSAGVPGPSRAASPRARAGLSPAAATASAGVASRPAHPSRYGLRQRQRASGQSPGLVCTAPSSSSSMAVPASSVAPRPGRGGGRGVADQDHAVARGAADDLQNQRIDVQAIGDDADVDARSTSATPARPGSRWCRGPIALKTWVTRLAPASSARVAVAASAPVCPMATLTPRARSARSGRAPRELRRESHETHGRDAVEGRDALGGRAQQVGAVDPGVGGARKGPSRWMPSIGEAGSAPGRASRSTPPRRASSLRRDHVGEEGRDAAREKRPPRSVQVFLVAEDLAAGGAVDLEVDEPARYATRRSPRRPGGGTVPGAAPEIRSPSIASQPGRASPPRTSMPERTASWLRRHPHRLHRGSALAAGQAGLAQLAREHRGHRPCSERGRTATRGRSAGRERRRTGRARARPK